MRLISQPATLLPTLASCVFKLQSIGLSKSQAFLRKVQTITRKLQTRLQKNRSDFWGAEYKIAAFPRFQNRSVVGTLAANPRSGLKINRIRAVSGLCSEVPRKISGKSQESSIAGKSSRIAKCFKFEDFGHRERQTCREPWVDTARVLVQTFCAGCLSKSTVTAFSSFSDHGFSFWFPFPFFCRFPRKQ